MRWTVLLVGALLLSPAAAQERAPKVKGVFIGTAVYDPQSMKGCTPLPDTRFDANDMRNSLVNGGVMGRDDTRLMTGVNKKAEILAAIKEQANGQKKGDTLVIYNSSHGSSGGKLCVYDGHITPKELAEALKDSKVGNVVVINDSCHSAKFALKIPGKKVAHVNAAEEDNVAYSSSDKTEGLGHKNGVLTRRVMEGLKGKRADLDGDGTVSTRELAAWARAGTKLEEKGGPTTGYYNNRRSQGPNHGGPDLVLVPTTAPGGDGGDLPVLVPRLMKVEKSEAASRIAADGLVCQVEPYVGDAIPGRAYAWTVGKVMKTVPREGTRVPRGTSVTIYVPRAEDLVEVPDVLEKKPSEAATAIRAVGLKVRHEKPTGHEPVIRAQEPAAGTKLIKGSRVDIINLDPGMTMVPAILGKKPSQAHGVLDKAGLVMDRQFEKPTTKEDYRKFPPARYAGRIWYAEPAPYTFISKIDPFTNDPNSVLCQVAPTETVKVPNLRGMSRADGEEALRKVGLVYKPSLKLGSKIAPGIFTFWPKPQAYPGDKISITIRYPEMPDLVGKTEEEAMRLCAEQKLVLETKREKVPKAKGFWNVIKQSPAKGMELRQGAKVSGVLPKGGPISIELDIRMARTSSGIAKVWVGFEIEGGTPPYTISGDHTETIKEAKGNFSFPRPPPGTYKVRLGVADSAGVVSGASKSYEVKGPPSWRTKMHGDLEAEFPLYPVQGRVKGEFVTGSITATWKGQFNTRQGNIWGGIVGYGPAGLVKGSFSGRRTSTGWRGNWKLDQGADLSGQFESSFPKRKR